MQKFILLMFALLTLASCTMSPPPSTSSGETTPVTKESKTIPTPTYGSGKKVVTVFADFQCPACINFSHGIGQILESYAGSGKLQIEYRQFPLQMHKNAKRDALAALCGAEQGKYMDYKKSLYDMEERKSEPNATISDADRVQAATKA
jgi:protein-disulfide isomerase